MKSLKTSSLLRLVALLLVAIVAICMVGFVAEGWQGDPQKQPDSGEADKNNGEADENKDGNGEQQITPAPPSPPEFTHYLTGLEISKDEAGQKPLCFYMDAASPLYGISGAPLMIEVPIENGQTRLLVYQDHAKALGKVGSIAPSRGCLDKLLDFFGGIAVYNGKDNGKESAEEPGNRFDFDLTKHTGYSYTENSSLIYSNGDLLLAGLRNAGVSTSLTESAALPFGFTPFFSEPLSFAISAQTVTLPFGEGNDTGLYYDAVSGQYLYGKGGQAKCDLLNGKNVAFTNAFVLFANATTYESQTSTELTIATDGGGTGYYFTGGTACPIEWSKDASGRLIFKNQSGELLTVNRGNTYISYYKASRIGDVIFS